MVKSSGRNVEKSGLKRGPWTPEEDRKLLTYLLQNGYGSWRSLPQKAGLQRCGKSCRLRWNNYLNPEIKRGNFSLHEEQTIIRLHALLGNKWAAIAANLPRRTDNEIKNHWNTHLKKRLAKMGIDPVTHKSSHISSSHHQRNNTTTATATNLISHMAQWESARLEAEARFGKETNNLNNVIKPYKNGPPQLLSHNNNNNNINNNGPPRCLDILTAWQNMCSSANQATTAISGGGRGGGGGGVGFGFNFGGGDLESPTSIFKFSEGENLGKRNINITGGNNLVVSAVSAVGGGGGGGGGGGLALHHHDQDQDHQVEDNDLIYDFSNKFWWDDIATMLDCELPNAPL